MDQRNFQRQLRAFGFLPCYNWDDQTRPPQSYWLILHLRELELSDNTSYQCLELDDSRKCDEEVSIYPVSQSVIAHANLHPTQLRTPAENVSLLSAC